MSADDLTAPLGQELKKRRRKLPITMSQALAGALALFFGVFVLWAALGDNPFGGEPMVVVPIDPHPGPAKTADDKAPPNVVVVPGIPGRYDGPPPTPQPADHAAAPPAPAATRTITIIDGKTGERQ